MNVDRFLRFPTEKEESVSLISKNFWHPSMVSIRGYKGSAYFSANVPDDQSLLASGVLPAREAESAGSMTEVPKAW
ncbi:MAG: hypothetical protein LC104_21460 [Bacteroidales bacterium]|nr:hypothetical protein [Bacteroidales bacterium]